MDRPPSPLFRQVAIEAASGTQIGAALTTHWRGVAAFTLAAFVLLAALIAFVAVVEYSPVHRVAAFVDARGGLVRLKAPLDGRVARLAVNDGALVRKGDLLAVIGSERLREEGGGERTAVRQSARRREGDDRARDRSRAPGGRGQPADARAPPARPARGARDAARRHPLGRAAARQPDRRRAITSPRSRPRATCRASRRRRSATRSARRRAGWRARAARRRASSARSRPPRPSAGSSTRDWPA